MKIDISKHYFGYYADRSEVDNLEGFSVGEIITDWEGEVGCILLIFKNGEVRTDSNGMGDIEKLKKTRSRKQIESYLKDLHRVDMEFLLRTHKDELEAVGKR